MIADLTAELYTTRYTKKSSPGTGFESRRDLERNRLRAAALPFRLCISFTVEGFNQHVVYLDFHGFADLLIENFIHEPLVGCSDVLQPKGHYLVAVSPSLDDEKGLRLVILVHQDLIIAGVGVHEAEQLIAGSCIHKLVDSPQLEVILRACFVGVIDANSPFVIFLFHN
ncbi:hypothetical protein L3X38_030676 [Prunus dulcis]|uniref:Uncharacterized protein n=1 Tax=Prunus dulcis TaxID=3755 RepID=A0AAD4VAT0_PRUDU|nr:hypothetical protein L3X38_030676 [Prunus dulcis]